MALLTGLEVLPPLEVAYHGVTLKEFDLDKALERKPKLILVDEFAHTNANTCRHAKRYQDVQELLNAGIDVYTTVNVQHLESLNDVVAQITGIIVRERIPDSVFDDNSQVELVDIDPDDLLERLKQGKIYREKQANKALGNFFTVENLISLREIALRRMADHINSLQLQADREKSLTSVVTAEHILICLSSSPSNPKVIRQAARMAAAFHAKFTAIYVETPDSVSYTHLDVYKRQDVSAGFDPLYESVFDKKNVAYLGKGIVFNKFTGSRGKSGSNDANAEYFGQIRKIMDDNKIAYQTAELGKVDVGGGGTIAYIMSLYGMEVIDCGVCLLYTSRCV